MKVAVPCPCCTKRLCDASKRKNVIVKPAVSGIEGDIETKCSKCGSQIAVYVNEKLNKD